MESTIHIASLPIRPLYPDRISSFGPPSPFTDIRIMPAFLIMGLASPQTHPRGSGEVTRVAPLTVVDLNQLISWSLVHLRGPPSGGGGELRDDHTPQLEATSQLTIQFPEK
jgi:hypothetical protein